MTSLCPPWSPHTYATQTHGCLTHMHVLCPVRTVSHAVTVTHTPLTQSLTDTHSNVPHSRPAHTPPGVPPHSCLSGVPGLGTVTPDCPTVLDSLVVGIDLVGHCHIPCRQHLVCPEPVCRTSDSGRWPSKASSPPPGTGPHSSRYHGVWAGLWVCQPELTRPLQLVSPSPNSTGQPQVLLTNAEFSTPSTFGVSFRAQGFISRQIDPSSLSQDVGTGIWFVLTHGISSVMSDSEGSLPLPGCHPGACVVGLRKDLPGECEQE